MKTQNYIVLGIHVIIAWVTVFLSTFKEGITHTQIYIMIGAMLLAGGNSALSYISDPTASPFVAIKQLVTAPVVLLLMFLHLNVKPSLNNLRTSMRTSPVYKFFVAIMLVCALSGLLPGCASDSGGGLTPAQWQAALSDVVQVAAAVEPLIQAYATNGKLNTAEAIPTAFNVLAIFAPADSVNVAQLSASVQASIVAYGGDGTTAQKIAKAFLAALPPNNGTITGLQANAALSQAGIGASQGASVVAAKQGLKHRRG